MKKFLSVVLAMLMVFSVMAPITVFAENGPYPFDPENEDIDFSKISSLSLTEMDSYDMLVLYPQIALGETPDIFSGASYDLETNTLTLNNVKAKTAVVDAYEMGDDFKIKLIGHNELAGISSSGTTRGSSITITGNGELVVNRAGEGFGIVVQTDSTASKIKIDKTVKLKVFSNTVLETPTIAVYGSTIRDSAQLIQLGGKVVAKEPEFEKYTIDIYEQIEAYDLEWNSYDWYEVGLKKDGIYYIADEEFDEETFESTGKYLVYSVTYDELIDCYVLNEYADGKAVSLDGFTVVTEYEPMYDESTGFYIGYTDYPEEEDDSYKAIFFPDYTDYINVCVDKKGKKYGFYEYDYEFDYGDGTIESGTDIYVYDLIEHPTYGFIAIEDESRNSLDGLTPLKIGEKKLADCYYTSDVVINNGGSIKEPAKIKNIKASNTNQGVKITWSAVKDAEKYRIYRKAAGQFKFTYLDTVSADKTSFVDKTVRSGKKYTYTVRGVNFVGIGDLNSTGAAITFYDTPVVDIKNITKGVNLKWAKVSGATKYRIYRKTSASSEWTRLDTVTGTSFTDKTAKSGKKYYYCVKAGKGDTMSGYNIEGKYYLAAPELSSIKNTNTGVKISWKEVKGADRYKVYRKYGGNSYEYIGTTEKTYYTDNSGNSGRVYTYTVKAAKSQTNSAYNKTGLKIRWVDANAFYTPDNVKNGVQLRWEPADKADKYYVYRKLDGETSFKQIDVVSADKLEKDQYGVYVYVDKSAKNGKTYFYNLKASYKNTLSGYANKVGRPVTYLDPIDVTSAKTTSKGIKIKWEASSPATKYLVLRKESGTDSGFKFHYFTNDASSTAFLDKDVKSGKKYYYKVQAIYDLNDGKGGWSAPGASKNATAK